MAVLICHITRTSLLKLIVVVLTLQLFYTTWRSIGSLEPSFGRTESSATDTLLAHVIEQNKAQSESVAACASTGWIPRAELHCVYGKGPAGSVNSIPGTTGAGIPSAIRLMLQKTGEEIVEDADTYYGSEMAVKTKEDYCGWNPNTSFFRREDCMSEVGFDPSEPVMPTTYAHLIDIVTPSIRDLDFLNRWREFFQGMHFIIIQDGDPDKFLRIPDWVDYELYNRNDIDKILGHNRWIISSKDASIRNFGFLVSKKPFIYTIDDDCYPAKGADGYYVNPLRLHLRNLLTPATPYFFNTLYDPYVESNDFVRGYPYSLRGGVVAVVSHGLWLNAPDYDAPTQLLKVQERNHRLLDTAVTIPHGILYPMCSMNVAFARQTIGPAFMQGLMGEGQPWGRYDDMFAGWASKVVADHLGWGVKSGQPYIYHNKASNPFTNLRKEYKGLWWQEELIRFLVNELKLPKEADNAVKAYRALAREIRAKFGNVHPYFKRLTRAMQIWTQIWEDAAADKVKFVPSRKSEGSVSTRYRELNIGEASWARNTLLTHPNYKGLFEVFGVSPSKRVVTDADVQVGSSWKTYILPLSAPFHKDAFNRYAKFGCLLSACNHIVNEKTPFHYEDYEAEAIILRKFLASLSFTENPEEADMILVPALAVTVANTRWYGMPNHQGCRNDGLCEDHWFKAVFKEVEGLKRSFKLKSTVRFVYTASIDTAMLHTSFARLLRDESSILLSYGNGGMVIPSLNNDLRVQPGHRRRLLALEERDVFLYVNFGVRHPVRTSAYQQLKRYRGQKRIVYADAGNKMKKNVHLMDAIHRAIFVFCLPGDYPFQKRFYDALAHGVIPIVARVSLAKGRYSHFFMNKVVKNHFEPDGPLPTPTIDNMYPNWGDVLGLSVQDVVVEVDMEFFNNGTVMQYLESIPVGVIRKKLRNVEKLRNYAIYNFEGSTPDAFSVILQSIARALP